MGRVVSWFLLAIAGLLLGTPAQAWWNGDWSYRKRITVAAPQGAQASLDRVPVVVRLHTGNFLFADARVDGADLRFVSADDRTPLAFHMERFDGVNEVAMLWVQVPQIAPGQTTEIWMYYGNANALPAADAKATYDASHRLVLHFREAEARPRDETGYANHAVRSGAGQTAAGVVDAGATLDGRSGIVIPATPSLAVDATRGLTVSLWMKSAEPEQNGVVYSQRDGAVGIELGTRVGRPYVQVADAQGKVTRVEAAGALATGAWQHVAVTASDRLALFVDGKEVASAPIALAAFNGDVVIGAEGGVSGFKGDIDEFQLLAVAQPAPWLAAIAQAQQPDGMLVGYGEDESTRSGAEYFAVLRVLANAVSMEGWIVIGLIGVLGFVSGETMIRKSLALTRIERGNRAFLSRFRAGAGDLAALEGDVAKELEEASLYRLYRTGLEELRRVVSGAAADDGSRNLSPQELEAIRAGVESALVEEAARMNSRMVLLTLSVSGAPFLGLLGTVVGIMITFGTIAMMGDVNVNTIAPGVAAALATTVMGLMVAIPVMFGYNQLATRIRGLTTATEMFANELMSRIALGKAGKGG